MNAYDDTEAVRTIDDLRSWDRDAPSLAVVGHPVAHSRSPRMHNAALRELGRPEKYYKFDIAPDRLAEALPLFHAKGFVGLNLTLPHKTDVLPLLENVSDFVQKAGAANTLIRTPSGYAGANTDGEGFVAACELRLGVKLAGAHVVLLGAGGAARAVAATIAGRCASLHIVNRNPARLAELQKLLAASHVSGATGFAGTETTIPDGALIVNCTSLGLKPDDPSPFPAKFFRPGMAVYDTVYGAHETALVRETRAAGVPVENGLSMLVGQGARALEIWTGGPVPVATMWTAAGGSGDFQKYSA